MIAGGDWVLLGLLTVVAVWCARSAWTALGPLRSVLRTRPRRVREITAGPVEIAGVLRAVAGPLTTLRGDAAIAVNRSVGYWYQRGGRRAFRPGLVSQDSAAAVEMTDDSGSCAIAMNEVILIGPRVARRIPAEQFATRNPEQWAVLSEMAGESVITAVSVDETYVPDGATGFVSGEAETDDASAPGEGYRDVQARWRVRGASGRPMVVCAWDEATARKHLARPSIILASLAAVCVLAAGAFVLGLYILAAAAGPSVVR